MDGKISFFNHLSIIKTYSLQLNNDIFRFKKKKDEKEFFELVDFFKKKSNNLYWELRDFTVKSLIRLA